MTYKKKNKFLIIAAIVFLLAAYSLSIKKTIMLYQECKELTNKSDLATNAPVKIQELEKKLAETDTLLGKSQIRDGNTQQLLLGVVTNYCQTNDIVLREFPRAINNLDKDFSIETSVFVVEGDFIKLLRLIYQLEQKDKIGRIASAHFQAKKDYRTQTVSLLSTIYLQNIKKVEHEN